MHALLQTGYPQISDLERLPYSQLFRNPTDAEKIHSDSNLHKNHDWYNLCLEEYNSIYERLGLGPSYRWTSFLFSGWKEKHFKHFAREIWLQNLESSKSNSSYVHPRSPLHELLLEFKKSKWKIKIITASPTWAIQVTTPELGLDESDVFGMNLVIKNDLTTSEIIEPYPYGEGKVETILKNFGQKPDIAFGDTINDFPMLKAASRLGVLFDRGNSELNKICRDNNIHVHDWI